jgi:hypothetical protein
MLNKRCKLLADYLPVLDLDCENSSVTQSVNFGLHSLLIRIIPFLVR